MARNKNKILLHACCGVCSAYPIFLLKELGFEPIVYFCNPNLDSLEEFNRRLDAQKKVCSHFNTELIVENYNPDEYLNYIKGLELEPEKGLRCDKCIELRLFKTSQKAKELKIQKFTTSLPISPHKNYKKICETGNKISEGFLAIDFKKKDGFLKTNKITKDLNIYRQNYCGCKFAK